MKQEVCELNIVFVPPPLTQTVFPSYPSRPFSSLSRSPSPSCCIPLVSACWSALVTGGFQGSLGVAERFWQKRRSTHAWCLVLIHDGFREASKCSSDTHTRPTNRGGGKGRETGGGEIEAGDSLTLFSAEQHGLLHCCAGQCGIGMYPRWYPHHGSQLFASRRCLSSPRSNLTLLFGPLALVKACFRHTRL